MGCLKIKKIQQQQQQCNCKTRAIPFNQPCLKGSYWGRQEFGSSGRRWRQGGCWQLWGEHHCTGLQSGPWRPSSSLGKCTESGKSGDNIAIIQEAGKKKDTWYTSNLNIPFKYHIYPDMLEISEGNLRITSHVTLIKMKQTTHMIYCL